MRKMSKIALPLVSVLFTLLAAEGLLRVFNYPKPVVSGWKTLDSYKSERHQLGFRGQPIRYEDDDFVVLLVGDSQVEAKACAYGWMPERLLQSHLSPAGRKIKVFSLGGPATGQDQQLLSLEEYYRHFRADLVVLWLTPANDIWNNMFPSGIPDDRTPKPTFWLENGQLRGPTERTGQTVREGPTLKLKMLWRKLFPYSREREWAKLLPPPYAPVARCEGAASTDWQERMQLLPAYLRYEHFDNDKNDRIAYLTPRSPRIQYGLDLTRRLMQEMERLVASHGGRFAVFRTGAAPGAKDEPGGEPDEVSHLLNGKCYKTSRSQYESNMSYLTEGFRSYTVAVTVVPPEVGPEDAHLNEHATEQVMKDLAAALRPLIADAR